MAVRTATQNGNWSSTSTWGGSAAPGNGDRAVVGAFDVTVDVDTTVGTSPPFTPNGSTAYQPSYSSSAASGTTNLPTGTYRVRYTNVDSGGVESSPSQIRNCGTITNGTTQPRVTLPALPTGVTNRRIYLTNTNGAEDTEKLYATGVTGTTYDLISASWMDGGDTYANATALPYNCAIDVTNGGSVLVPDNVTLTVRGDIRSNGTSDVTVDDGGTLMFDSSASVGTTAIDYTFWCGTTAFSNTGTKFAATGTSGNRATITSHASGGKWNCWPIHSPDNFNYSLGSCQMDMAFCDLSRMGRASAQLGGWSWMPNSSSSRWKFDDCNFDDCATIYTKSTIPNSVGFVLDGMHFENSLDATNGCINTLSAAPSTGARTMDRCFFDLVVALNTDALVIDRTVFKRGWTFQGAPSVAWTCTRSMLGTYAAGSPIRLGGEVSDCYLFADASGSNTNPQYFLYPITALGLTNPDVEYCVVESLKDGATGDVMHTQAGYNCRMRYSIVLPSATSSPRTSSGCFTQFGATPSSSQLTIEHCTWMAGTQGLLNIGESTQPVANDVQSVKSNIVWCDSGQGGLMVDQITSPDLNNACPGSVCTHNCKLNLGVGSSGGGYNVTSDSSYGTNDITADPSFVDDTRNLSNWAVSKGSASGTVAGRQADAFAYIYDDPDLISDELIPWIQAGFVPQNEALRDAGHDGVTIGAMEMAAPSGPEITSDGGGDTASVNVNENQTAVTTVTATGNGTISYSITGGVDSAKFSIVSGTGVLTFVSAPDYENPTDSDTDNDYVVEVTATDDDGTDEQEITVTVGNVADSPPSISVNPYIAYGGFVGRTQATTNGTWNGSPSGYTYQWGRANDGSGTGAAAITGETASTYTFATADQEKYVYCDVTATNAFGSTTQRSNYRFCYERVALPTATELARDLDDLSGYDGKELFTEATVDTSAAMPDPVTWKNESPQNTKDFSFFSVAVDTSTRVRDNNSGCVKISENWGMVANHVPGNGDAYIFLNTDGDTEISVGYDSTVQIGDTSTTTSGDHDLRLIHFDGPVSDAEVPPLALPTAGLYNALGGEYCLAIERGRHLNRLLLDAGNTSSDPDTTWAATTADVLEDGDSGKAVFAFVDGTPVAVGTNIELTTTAPNPAHWLREIQDVLASTGDSVTLVRLESTGTSGGIGGSVGSTIMRSINRSDRDDIEL